MMKVIKEIKISPNIILTLYPNAVRIDTGETNVEEETFIYLTRDDFQKLIDYSKDLHWGKE